MKTQAISFLLISCFLGLVFCTGNDFKIGKPISGNDFIIGKKQDDDIVQTRAAVEKPTYSAPKADVNWCEKSDDKCPLNVCEQAGKVCCWCDMYCNWQSFGAIQPCFCCPKGYVCCGSSKPLQLNAPPSCCPSDSECDTDGRSCVRRTKSVSATVLTELCGDSTVDNIVNPKLPNKDRSVSNTIW